MKRFLRSTSATLLALAAAGCTTPTPQALQPTDLPQSFTAPMVKSAQIWPQTNWWTSFNSPEMTDVIMNAQNGNLDLAASYARVLQAEAQAGISRSVLFPQLGLDTQANRSRADSVSSNSFRLSGDVNYQLDLFGKNRDNYRAALETLRSSKYAQQAEALTITSDAADDYLTVVALRERLKIARDNIAASERVLNIVKAKVTNGVSSNLDLAQEQAVVAGQEAAIPALEQQERAERYALATVLGQAPERIIIKAQNFEGFTPPVAVPGIPSDLLLRRPDIAQAEAALASAHARVDAARAAYFPSIGLTGAGGVESSALGSLFSGPGLFYSLGAQLLQTIFDGGLLESESDLAKAQQQELVADYRQSVLNAFSDVETSLSNAASLAEQERLTTIEVNNAAEAFRISEIQYREGVADLLAVLQAQQTLFTSQDTLVQIKLQRLEASISLYRALGGGWSQNAADNTQTAPVPAPQPTSTEAAPASNLPELSNPPKANGSPPAAKPLPRG